MCQCISKMRGELYVRFLEYPPYSCGRKAAWQTWNGTRRHVFASWREHTSPMCPVKSAMALCRQNKLMAYGLMALPPEPARSDSKYFPKIEVPARTAGCSVTPSGCFLLSAGPVAGAAAQATGCVFPGSGQGAGRPESWTLPLAPPGRPARRRLARTDSQRTADTDNQPARRRAESQGRRMNPLRPGRVRSVS